MTQEEYDRTYGPAVDNLSSQEDLDEQQSRIDKNNADTKLQQQQIELQQQQQDTQHLMVVGGLALGGVLVLVLIAYLIMKLNNNRKS